MSMKEALTNSLLMFVAATCVVLIVKSLSWAPQTPQVAVQDGVKVYYLHGNIRCPTCRTIEAYAQEAVETGFADELKSGKVQWQVINYESPGNEHYALEY